jgi:aconitase A
VVENEPGKMPDGAVIIAAITSCTNTNNPRNVIAAAACWHAMPTGWPDCASRG